MAIDITAPGADLAALKTALANLLILSAFRASKTSNTTDVASGIATKVLFDTEVFDIGANFASSIWTPPAGLVSISAGLSIAGTNLAANEQQIRLFKNGASIRSGGQSVAAAAACKPNLFFLDQADGDDTYEVYVLLVTSSGTGTITGSGASGVGTYFQGMCFAQ